MIYPPGLGFRGVANVTAAGERLLAVSPLFWYLMGRGWSPPSTAERLMTPAALVRCGSFLQSRREVGLPGSEFRQDSLLRQRPMAPAWHAPESRERGRHAVAQEQ